MSSQLCFKFRIPLFASGSGWTSQAAVPACLTALMVSFASANAYAVDATPASASTAAKMEFPEGTATPSEACGVCHKMMFSEMSDGTGSDLNWKSMKVQSTSKTLLDLPPNVSRSTTAHYVAGTDPWPDPLGVAWRNLAGEQNPFFRFRCALRAS